MALPEVKLYLSELQEIEDPRTHGTINGRPARIGELVLPEPDQFPGWHLHPVETDDPNNENWMFALAPMAYTGPGMILLPEEYQGRQKPQIYEYPLEGNGHILLQLPTGLIRLETFDRNAPRIIGYGPGTIVAYFANVDGLVGMNTTTRGLQEPILPIDSDKINDDFRAMYLRFARR
jgi:hypothetical protein